MVLNATHFRFDDFRVDVPGRQLWRGDRIIELNGRYFDALVLLLREHGELISKERFFEEVWRGVIVSDSALTQCIKDIRRQLGDDAAAPRYVQTVPRYGYRFVGKVDVWQPDAPSHPVVSAVAEAPAQAPPQQRKPLERAIREGIAGTLGGGVAGLVGGLFYGLVMASATSAEGVGTFSTMVVFLSLGVFIGMAGGFGVSCGIAAAGLWGKKKGWIIVGAALGGMLVGGIGDLLGLDAFNLLFGRTLPGITGALEGALLGAMLAGGALLGGGFDAFPSWRPVVGAGVAGAVAGVLIPLAGGQLFAGSLKSLEASFATSRLRLDALGSLFGDAGMGTTTQALLGGVEALLFGICLVGGLVLARRVNAHSVLSLR